MHRDGPCRTRSTMAWLASTRQRCAEHQARLRHPAHPETTEAPRPGCARNGSTREQPELARRSPPAAALRQLVSLLRSEALRQRLVVLQNDGMLGTVVEGVTDGAEPVDRPLG